MVFIHLIQLIESRFAVFFCETLQNPNIFGLPIFSLAKR